jgi:hypothetical protein
MDTILTGLPSVVGVELEVDGPHPVRCVRLRRVRCRARPQPLGSPLLRHSQAFLAPQPLDLLVVDVPALVAGVVVGVAESAPRMILGPRL